MVPTVGAEGIGTGLIVIPAVGAEVHPPSFVTVKVNVPVGSPDRVKAPPVHEVVILPGILVNVQVPGTGKPVKSMLPLGMAHVGCVGAAAIGAAGVPD